MIHADDVMPLLVAAVPSFAEQWQALQHDPIHTGEDGGTRLHYLDAGDFARHLLDLQRSEAHDEVRAAFGLSLIHI